MNVHNVKPRIAVAQLGARRHYAIPAMLYRAGLLSGFYTDMCADVGWGRALGCFIPPALRPGGIQRLLARRVKDVPREKIHCASLFGLARVLRRTRALTT